MNNWSNNALQFPRLIAELEGVGVFTEDTMIKLATEMDLSQLEITELIDRACSEWDKIKSNTIERHYETQKPVEEGTPSL